MVRVDEERAARHDAESVLERRIVRDSHWVAGVGEDALRLCPCYPLPRPRPRHRGLGWEGDAGGQGIEVRVEA